MKRMIHFNKDKRDKRNDSGCDRLSAGITWKKSLILLPSAFLGLSLNLNGADSFGDQQGFLSFETENLLGYC